MQSRSTDAFLDSGHVIALHWSDDPFNRVAIAWAEHARRARWRLITTVVILAEIGDAFRKQPQQVQRVLAGLIGDPTIEVVPVTLDLLDRALDLRNRRLDKEWGLTDCISFVVMQERGIGDALAADRHFEQAGFRALLRETPPGRIAGRR